jgi:hypothetical protein
MGIENSPNDPIFEDKSCDTKLGNKKTATADIHI